jgi:predicted lipoprotein
MRTLKKYSWMGLVGLAILNGCDPKDSENSKPKTEYDRAAMLANYSDNLIVPGYLSLKNETAQLDAAVTAFVSSPTEATLGAARTEFQEAYAAWQQVSPFDFGPADQHLLQTSLNIYPTNTTQIENNITAGTYDLAAAANLAAQGFPALDYLLYYKATAPEVIAQYTTGSQAANRKAYLQELTQMISQKSENVYNNWTTGNYSKTFKESTGTAVGSAVGNLVNQLNASIDLTKRNKVGIPAGKFTAGSPLPEKTEAYYSRTSLDLLKKVVQTKKDIFLGQNAAGQNGSGLDDYLNQIGAKYNNQPLAEAITKQFDAAVAAINAVPTPLAEAVSSNATAVNRVYEELQKLIVLTKTDMPSALGVSITYTDNDGD